MVRTSAGCRTCRSVGKLAAMKSRGTISLLLAAVVAVWGLVAWKILTPGREGLRVAVPERSVGKHPAAVADTLQLDYPDPFLKAAAVPEPMLQPPVRQPPSERKRPRRERIQAVHLGSVSVVGRQLHILTLGGRQYELPPGDTAGGFRFRSYDADSLYLEKKGFIYGVKRCE